MSEARTRFEAWTSCLLDPARSPGEQRAAANEWCAWALEVLGIDENAPSADRAEFAATRLPTGKAISPVAAARCVREYRRTAVFLQGVAAAIAAARARFPGEVIHVVEAGCGPLAPLTLPFALRYPPEEVCFTLLDLHPAALQMARRLADELEVTRSIRALAATDVTSHRFAPAERPHIIACEVLLATLRQEPQVAATLNLRPQLRSGGSFIPERIAVHGVLFDLGRYTRALKSGGEATSRALVELGEVFALDASPEGELPLALAPGTLAASALTLPSDAARTPLHLCTRIRVFREHTLGDFESSLNLPERVRSVSPLVERGGRIDFRYEISAHPGLRATFAAPNSA